MACIRGFATSRILGCENPTSCIISRNLAARGPSVWSSFALTALIKKGFQRFVMIITVPFDFACVTLDALSHAPYLMNTRAGLHFVACLTRPPPDGHLNIWYRFRPFPPRHWRARATPLTASITKAVCLSLTRPPSNWVDQSLAFPATSGQSGWMAMGFHSSESRR